MNVKLSGRMLTVGEAVGVYREGMQGTLCAFHSTLLFLLDLQKKKACNLKKKTNVKDT